MKECLGCGVSKSLEEFHRAKLGKDGRRSRCIECYKPYFDTYHKRPERAEKNRESSKRSYHKVPIEKRRIAWKARMQRDPMQMLGKGLRRALYRRPTENHVTLNQLMEMWRKQDGKCAVTGLVMTWAKGTYLPTSISIDRIDSSIGYRLDNVRLICYAINAFKGVWSDDHMIEMARAIVAKNSS